MTREEAVAVLKAFMENPLFSDVHKAAFNIAIHDIKQRHDWGINNLILINKESYEPHCQYSDEEIAKSFIEDVEAVKDQLSCGNQMEFPNTFDEFAEEYGFTDKDEVYTNGSKLISVFRVKQWLEHISSATPQKLRKGKWIIYLSTAIEDFYQCSECGRMVHIKQTDSIKNYPYCHCGAKMVEPQESEVEDGIR